MIKQLMEAGNGSVRTPEVRVSFEDNYLGEGVTGLRGVLSSMSINSETECSEGFDGDLCAEADLATSLRTTICMEIVLTSLELGPEKLKELTEKVVAQLQRALEF